MILRSGKMLLCSVVNNNNLSKEQAEMNNLCSKEEG